MSPLTLPTEVSVELIKLAQVLSTSLVAGAFLILGAWLVDRRRVRIEHEALRRRERALLTAMFAVRQHIVLRLNEYDADGLESQLQHLRTPQAYVHRLIEKAPGESEALMIAVVEVGLKLDSILATLDTPRPTNSNPLIARAALVTRQIGELAASLEFFDLVAGQGLDFLTDEDLAGFGGAASDSGSRGAETATRPA